MRTPRLSRALVIGVLLATATASLGTTPALARIKKPGLDSLSQECFRVQTESDKLVAEYKNASDARREAILTELRQLGSYWRAAGCQALFGDISKFVPRTDDFRAPPPASLSDGGVDGGAAAPGGGNEQPEGPGPIFLY